jgi:hypothetical protein
LLKKMNYLDVAGFGWGGVLGLVGAVRIVMAVKFWGVAKSEFGDHRIVLGHLAVQIRVSPAEIVDV